MSERVSQLDKWLSQLSDGWYIYIKRLSSNDTGLTGGHQAGVYVPKNIMVRVFPQIQSLDNENPDHHFRAQIVSHAYPEQTLRAIYYNSRPRGTGTRNEQRITRWNTDVTDSPIQDADNTGALCVLAFKCPDPAINSEYLQVWVCDNPTEEELIEAYTGEIIPGQSVYGLASEVFGGIGYLPHSSCDSGRLPDEWHMVFPDGASIVDYVVNRIKPGSMDTDKLLLKRRDCEFAVFQAIEESHVLGKIQNGFSSVEDFIKLANAVSNRRKSRSGRSLELHLERIFVESGLSRYGTQCTTESNKKPDFIFPSCEHYHDQQWPDEKLRMLAVKTTCKDRWRQILNEADRIDRPHLFTLQEGVSHNQFREMEAEGVQLVVPQPLHDKFPDQIRVKLLTLQQFIEETRDL